MPKKRGLTSTAYKNKTKLTDNLIRNKTMTHKDINTIKAVTGFDEDEINEVMESMSDHEDDFTIGDFRFIAMKDIDRIMKDELSWDTYVLGFFTASFIAEILDLETSVIEHGQEAACYELLGAMMLKKIDKVQRLYVRYDGYGPHFAHYDGHEYELTDYYLFHV